MNFTNEMNLPEPFVNATKSSHTYKKGRYSVTELLGGTCEAILKRRHDHEMSDDVSSRVWAVLGTAVHKILSDAEATDTQLQEQWFSVEVHGGYTLSGIFDLYDEATKTVTDWKTTSVWTVIFGDFEKWRRQTLTYCWMLERHGFEARRGEIVAILRDHSARKAKTEMDYPKHPVFCIGWDFTDEDMRWAERYISEWFSNVALQEKLPDHELEMCSPEERWHKPDKWAVMEKGKKKALRVLESEDAAKEWAKGKGIDTTDDHYYLEFREGEDTRCQSYCSVAQFCPYWKKYFQDS